MKTKLTAIMIVCLFVFASSVQAQVASKTSVGITDNYFSGNSNVTTKGFGGLADITQKVAARQAFNLLQNATSAYTNSTGSTLYPSYKLVAMDETVDTFVETGTASVTKAAFDAWIAQINTAAGVLGESISEHNRYVGLPPIGNTSFGERASAYTVTAVTNAFYGAASSLVTASTANTDIIPVIRNNVKTLAVAANRLGKALGQTPALDVSAIGGYVNTYTGNTVGQLAYETLVLSGAATTGTVADPTYKAADLTAYAVILGKNLATITQYLDDILFYETSSIGALTDNSGGTGATTVPAFPDIDAYTTAGTDLTAFAEFNTSVGVVQTGISSLTLQINKYNFKNGKSKVLDETGKTPSTTIAVIDDSMTAVDGSANNALKYAEATIIKTAVEENLTSLVKQVNILGDVYGIARMTDNTGVSPSDTFTIDEVSAATTGGDGTLATGVSKTQADAWLDSCSDAIASINDHLDKITTASGYLNVPFNLTAKY